MDVKQSEKNKTTGEPVKILEKSIQQTFRQIISLAFILAVIFGLWMLLAGCAERTLEVEISSPRPLLMTSNDTHQRAFVDRSESSDWFYFSSTLSGDSAVDHSPVRLTITVPLSLGLHTVTYPDGGLFFRDEELQINCDRWTGTSNRQDQRVEFIATCDSDSGVTISGIIDL